MGGGGNGYGPLAGENGGGNGSVENDPLYICVFADGAGGAIAPLASCLNHHLFANGGGGVWGRGAAEVFGADALATWVDPTAPDANELRVYSYLGNPNLLAAYILPALILSLCALVAWRHWGPKILAALFMGLHSACLYWTGCRGAWLGLAGALLVLTLIALYWLLPRLPRFWQIWLIPITMVIMVAVLCLGMLGVEPLRARVMSIFAGRSNSSNNFRINVWEAVQAMIIKRPVLGIGPGNSAFNKIYPLFQRPNYTALSAYSIYLETLVEVGMVGFSIFLWLLGLIFYQSWQQIQRLRNLQSQELVWLGGAISTITSFLIHGFVDTVWYRPEINTLWWLMVAIVASFYRPTWADDPMLETMDRP